MAVILCMTVLVSAAYLAYYWYWGRRHQVLYDVKTVTLSQEQDTGNYSITVAGTAKTWPLDPHTATLYLSGLIIRGDPQGAELSIQGTSPVFTFSHKSTPFEIVIPFEEGEWQPGEKMDKAVVFEIEETMQQGEFDAYDPNGNILEGKFLYLQDQDYAFIFE